MGDAAISQRDTKTRARSATKSKWIRTGLHCPACDSPWILACVSRNARAEGHTHWCAACSAFFAGAVSAEAAA